MIWESAPWKSDLLRDADTLQRWAREPATQRRLYMFEKKIFLAAYSIRKLNEAGKLKTSFRTKSMRCTTFERQQTRMTPWNWDDLGRHYQLKQPTVKRFRTPFVMNQIIHSHVFMIAGTYQNLANGFYVSSDYEKERQLLKVSLSVFCKIMRSVGRDHPTASASSRYDAKTNKWIVETW